MAIADTKVVSEIALVQIGIQNETILVLFIRIIWNESDSCSESVFSDDISLNEDRFFIFNSLRDSL